MANKTITDEDKEILIQACKVYEESMRRNNPRELPAVGKIRKAEADKVASVLARLQAA